MLAPPALTAIVVATLIGGLLVFASGYDPVEAYARIVEGALAWTNLPNTLNWATPLVGMSIAAAIPIRGGMINLGGDGQMVIGGLVGAMVPLVLPGPGLLAAIVALVLAAVAAGLYAALAAWGEMRHRIPMLISSLLLSYPAVGVASYCVRFPFRDTTTGLPQTALVPAAARLPNLGGTVNIGLLIMAALAAFIVFVDRRAVIGYELRMRGINARFAGYGGVRLDRQAMGAMFAMQRETSVPRVLTMVLQAIVILFLAMRHGLGRRET